MLLRGSKGCFRDHLDDDADNHKDDDCDDMNHNHNDNDVNVIMLPGIQSVNSGASE